MGERDDDRSELIAALRRDIASLRQALVVEQARLGIERTRSQRAEQRFGDLMFSRRWRAAKWVMGPFDRLRGHRPVTGRHFAAAHRPAPFVVGVARSGTGLLRSQLDAHPQLAIGHETGWGLVLDDVRRAGADPATMAAGFVGLETFDVAGLSVGELGEILARPDPWTIADALRAFYTDRAAREGKPRWGDKTPAHIRVADQLSDVLEEAHIVHLIRDGRGVLASIRALAFAPGDGSVEAIADDWSRSITAIRAAAAAGRIAHYREVRYEQLVRDPETVLRELCEWIELPFDAAMLRAHERAVERGETGGWHEHVGRPPDPSRDGRWRTELGETEISRFEAVAGELLAELGYEPYPGPVPAGPSQPKVQQP